MNNRSRVCLHSGAKSHRNGRSTDRGRTSPRSTTLTVPAGNQPRAALSGWPVSRGSANSKRTFQPTY